MLKSRSVSYFGNYSASERSASSRKSKSADHLSFEAREKGRRGVSNYSDFTPYRTGLKKSPKRILKAADMTNDKDNNEPCNICTKTTGKFWIQCDHCKFWYHALKCEKLDEPTFNLYKDHETLEYLCKKCKINL